MILDFLKKHWKIVFSVMGVDLLSILIVTKFYLHESIMFYLGLFVFVFVFMETVQIIFSRFIQRDGDRVSPRVEGNILISLGVSVYATTAFFINPAENEGLSSIPFVAFPYIYRCIFFARKYNVSGCWLKKDEDENP